MSTHDTHGPFEPRFDQLAVFENLRTPLFLLESEYNRARACWSVCDGMPVDHIEQLAAVGNGVMSLTVYADDLKRERDELLAALRRLSFAAMSRENVMGDPCSLLAAKAELAAANKAASEVIAKLPAPLNDWARSRAQVDNLHRNELNERTTDNLGFFS